MKPFLLIPACCLLFLLSLAALQAKTPGEISNFLKQAPIPELKGNPITVTQALAAVNQMAELPRKKIRLDVAVPQKADTIKISLDLRNSNAYEAIRTICVLSGLEFTIKRDQILIY